MDVESADLDGDGDLDLVVAMEYRKNRVFFNDNGMFFEDGGKILPTSKLYPNPSVTGEDSEDILIRDFDLDGDPDILFATEDTDLHEFLLNDGDGLFSLAPFQFPKTLNCNAIASLDLNGDSLPDVIFGNQGKNETFINMGNGSFLLDTVGLIPMEDDSTQDLKVVDIDGDGDLDIVEGIEFGGNNLYINHITSWERDSTRLPALGDIETRKIVPADADHDGDMDLFLCNVGWTPGKNPQNLLLINDGAGNFTDETLQRIPVSVETTLDAVFLDLNSDGYLDLITTSIGGSTNQRVMQNDPNSPGMFSWNQSLLPGMPSRRGITVHPALLDEDTIPDLYFGNSQGRDVLLLSEQNATGLIDNTQTDITIYPNPGTGRIWFESARLIESVVVIDQSGKGVITLENQAKERHLSLEISNAGTYQLLIRFGDGNSLTRKLIVN